MWAVLWAVAVRPDCGRQAAPACPLGQTFCAAQHRCVWNWWCYTDADCVHPPECRVVPATAYAFPPPIPNDSGAACSAVGTCDYPPLRCGDQACLGHSCIPSPLKLEVAPERPRFRRAHTSRDQATDVAFTATLTNRSGEDVAVSATESFNIELLELRRNGRNVTNECFSSYGDSLGDGPESRDLEVDGAIVILRPAEKVQFGLGHIVCVRGDRSRNESPGSGIYSARFRYHYSGYRSGVFRGTIESDEATFGVE